MPIVRDEHDRRRFLLLLAHANDIGNIPANWFRDILDERLTNTFQRPYAWKPQEKIVRILSFCLVENHFHLLLKEITEGGVAKFMQKIGTSMARHFNERHGTLGALFQGAFRLKAVAGDDYLRLVSAYIQVKNAFELYPQGYQVAVKNFDQAFEWAKIYRYCSLGDFLGTRKEILVEPEILYELFTPQQYKEFSRVFIQERKSEEMDFLI